MSRWPERAWRLAGLAALLGATWLLLAPSPPGVGSALPFGDKLQHALLFALLALLTARAYRGHPRWGIFAALVFYGICIEIAQPRVGRAFEGLDVAADAVGSLAAWFVPRHAQRSSPAPPSARS